MSNPFQLTLDEDERAVLIAGMASGQEREVVWNRLRPALERLRARNLIDWIESRGANGQILVSVPRGLSQAGVRVARQLVELRHQSS
jgi:hypothetical protein